MYKLGLFLVLLLQFSCTSQQSNKINGISLVASREEVTQEHLKPVLQLGANHAAVMPFGFIKDVADPQIHHNSERQWFGEKAMGVKQYTEMLHKNNIAVMIKPQLWMMHGVFTGTLKADSEDNWMVLEKSYSSFILTYAKVAQETNAQVFCIGTELEQFVKHRPLYWKNLIKEIRAIYKGKLTYAANWDEYPKTSFWEALDYIGVDAYFPVSEEEVPSLKVLKEGWQKWKVALEKISIKTNKPILFTEFGYRSVLHTGKKPWLVDRTKNDINLEGQAIALEAIFLEFWKEDWFAGGYVWKWFINHKKAGGDDNNRFTPQNKPAEETIRSFYKQY